MIGIESAVARLAGCRRFASGPTFLILASLFCFVPSPALATEFCSQTADLVFQACKHEAEDDFLIASAKCINISDDADRSECNADAATTRSEDRQLCQEQLSGRLDNCKSIGEERYDPDFHPADFDSDFSNLPNPNPYFPLRIGNRWQYHGAGEVNTVEILNRTKLIDGVRCVVVRDLVSKGGFLVEATDDWFAQAENGDVWYCGEEVKDFETFQGDRPQLPELVSIDGSFKAGREGDKPGLIFLAEPQKGKVYIEEFSLGNAEDVTEVLTTTYSYGKFPQLDRFVPRNLAKFLCSGDCVVTKNFSLLEPGIFARKYFAPGIGFFLEVNPDTGETVRLVKCNFDSRCGRLPVP